ncbi:uncharacterized protein LOC106673634 [Cimex lectularius]|uniref:Uncharacterized protein n=1 Tax=Cimex lectularius TaxID=79782 RepID=A0A8I6SRB9_CIMLE|nr:uncharacterized protein LOC106673634 [Cimex lectularius]XP_024085491.1 uncharacterized protein LOC106673634 [Cimex lectularius]XP_024085492.1 uncharacterized protein LOC106673634 [Cimex lectularius]
MRRKECDSWTSYAFENFSESSFIGPTIDETLLYLVALILPRCWLIKMGLVHDPDLQHACKTAHCSSRQETHKNASEGIDIASWLTQEYLLLAEEVCRKGMDDRLESRRFVLNSLAELMEMKQKLENQKKKQT